MLLDLHLFINFIIFISGFNPNNLSLILSRYICDIIISSMRDSSLLKVNFFFQFKILKSFWNLHLFNLVKGGSKPTIHLFLFKLKPTSYVVSSTIVINFLDTTTCFDGPRSRPSVLDYDGGDGPRNRPSVLDYDGVALSNETELHLDSIFILLWLIY